jgi:hypothetical protein
MFRTIRISSLIVFLAWVLAACRQEPVQPPQPVQSTQPAQEPYIPGLGEIMTMNQMRHIKLWFAGKAANWPLASYELDELEEGFGDVATFHPTHKDAELPIPTLLDKIMKEPILQVRSAIDAKDQGQFSQAFDNLTLGCNSCHQATKFGFNVVARPSTNPYSNQVFEPAK